MDLSYELLKEFYLRHNVYGLLGDFNKQNFPNDWEDMRKELEYMIGEDKSRLSGEDNQNKGE